MQGTICGLFDDALGRHADEPALRTAGGSMTYADLSQRVDLLAARLGRAGVESGDTVVVATPRSAQEVIAVLAVLRAGAAYSSIDLRAPAARATAMLAQLRPRLVLGWDEGSAALAAMAGVPGLDPREGDGQPAGSATETDDAAGGAERWAPPVVSPDQPAYVSFTSGTTGAPKGVVIPHRAVVGLVTGADYVSTGPGQRFLRLAPLAFDASTFELFCALGTGACVEVYPAGPVAATELATFLRRQRVTVAWLTAGLFRVVQREVPSAFDSLRHLVTGGDVVPAAAVAEVLARPSASLDVTNGYGPTENTTFTTTLTVASVEAVTDPLPIGRPVAGTTAYVLGPDLDPVAVGDIGELCVAGSGLALGYLPPHDSSSSFVYHPTNGVPLYRTGDLVKFDESGLLHFLGRMDRQIKVRGHRVEPGEVEAHLREHADVRDAIITIAGTSPDGPRLIAGLVPQSGCVLDLPKIRDHLRDRLPEAAVPSAWAAYASFPMTENGKIDLDEIVRDARLPASSYAPVGPPEPSHPRSRQLEELLRDVWSEVLGHDDFDDDEAFFDVGGDSLRAASMHTLLLERLDGTPVRIVDLFQHPTIATLAAHLSTMRA